LPVNHVDKIKLEILRWTSDHLSIFPDTTHAENRAQPNNLESQDAICEAGRRKMLRIFLADNHVLIRAGLRAVLRARRDFSICGEARNGRDAVQMAIQSKPDIVIIDINQADMNGVDAIRQIREGSPDTEILIFTADSNEDLIREARHAGAGGYLSKLVSDAEIIGAIEALARGEAYPLSPTSEIPSDSLVPQIRDQGDEMELTPRERQIVQLIAEGHRSREIARMLGISMRAVETHRAAAMRKLQLRSVADIVRYAIREKLIQA
jgi:DNA-binding NarL/FixJ family response regulator